MQQTSKIFNQYPLDIMVHLKVTLMSREKIKILIRREKRLMKEFYTVGEVSKIFNLPASTLRYYDSIGLLSPWKTGENGYRYYSKAQFEIISMIGFMRSLGTPIRRLTEILNSENTDGIRKELGRYVSEIDDQIARLEKLKTRAARFDRDIEDVSRGADIRIVRTPGFYTIEKAFGDEDELDIDEIFATNSQASDWAFSAGIISTITVENLHAGNFHTYDQYGYLSEEPFPGESKYLGHILPRLCVCGNLKVKTVEHSEADEVYAGMIAYVHEHGYEIAGPAIERNILDIYSGQAYKPTIFFKVYIPVK